MGKLKEWLSGPGQNLNFVLTAGANELTRLKAERKAAQEAVHLAENHREELIRRAIVESKFFASVAWEIEENGHMWNDTSEQPNFAEELRSFCGDKVLTLKKGIEFYIDEEGDARVHTSMTPQLALFIKEQGMVLSNPSLEKRVEKLREELLALEQLDPKRQDSPDKA